MRRQLAHPLLIALAFAAFFSLGLPDCTLGVAWPSIRRAFDRPLDNLGVLLSAGIAGYLTASFLGGQLLRAIGLGSLLWLSCLFVAAAMSGYTLAPSWGYLAPAAVLGGLGAGAIDVGINSFAASRFSPRVVNWLHAFWGIGATSGPLLMTAVLTEGQSWRAGYLLLAAILGLLTLLFLLTRSMWAEGSTTGEEKKQSASIAAALRQPVVRLQALLFLAYAGVEAPAGQLLFSLLTEGRGRSIAVSGLAVSGYWAALTVGRLVFGQAAVHLERVTVLRIGTTCAPVASFLVWQDAFPALNTAGAILLGFVLAPIFPTLISVTPKRVGEFFAPQAIAFQVTAGAIGWALLPGFAAALSAHWGLGVLGAFLTASSLIMLLLHEIILRTCSPEGVETTGLEFEIE